MGASWGSNDVRFDFDGSLEVARKLWSLADGIEESAKRRYIAAGTALLQWQGPFTDLFRERVAEELRVLNLSTTELRDGARHWATAWKQAMDENNRRRRARHVKAYADQMSSERSAGERFVDFLSGGDDSDELAAARTPAARQVATPVPPAFAPTDAAQRF